MEFIKNWGMAILSLLVMLILLQFVLKAAKKVPVLDGVAEKAEDLAFNQ